MSASNAISDDGELLVVVPWLEGGGAQRALEGVLRELDPHRLHLVILFGDDRHAGVLREMVRRVTVLGERKTPVGVARAAWRLRALTAQAQAAYSLMRGSHLVLGVGSVGSLRRIPFAASFHMLPSDDSSSLIGRVEDVLVRRATKAADLVTAPSARAVVEIADFGFADPSRIVYEKNRVHGSERPLTPPRNGELKTVRLLIACRLTSQKGLDRLPEILEATEKPVELRIFGDGELESFARHIADEANPPHRVSYLGRTDNVFTELDDVDALIMPSRAELNPVLVWEAWSRGRPVVASDLSVFIDLQRQGPVTTCSDAADFGEAIGKIARSERLRRDAYATGPVAFAEHLSEGSALAEFFAS